MFAQLTRHWRLIWRHFRFHYYRLLSRRSNKSFATDSVGYVTSSVPHSMSIIRLFLISWVQSTRTNVSVTFFYRATSMYSADWQKCFVTVSPSVTCHYCVTTARYITVTRVRRISAIGRWRRKRICADNRQSVILGGAVCSPRNHPGELVVREITVKTMSTISYTFFPDCVSPATDYSCQQLSC